MLNHSLFLETTFIASQQTIQWITTRIGNRLSTTFIEFHAATTGSTPTTTDQWTKGSDIAAAISFTTEAHSQT